MNTRKHDLEKIFPEEVEVIALRILRLRRKAGLRAMKFGAPTSLEAWRRPSDSEWPAEILIFSALIFLGRVCTLRKSSGESGFYTNTYGKLAEAAYGYRSRF